jgi:transcriptional regulator with GAF, ATPase, and Fis domain
MAAPQSKARVWVHCLHSAGNLSEATVIACLAVVGVAAAALQLPIWEGAYSGPGIVILQDASPEAAEAIRALSQHGREHLLALTTAAARLSSEGIWSILEAGAADVLIWDELSDAAAVLAARLERWRAVDEIMQAPLIRNSLVGHSRTWQTTLRQIIEVARFTDAPVLLMGETGTGKELAAKLIHALDLQRNKHELAILDCSTVVPDLSGSEFFGHERGSYTGAVAARDGAFALAHQGTLFLDEVGELPLVLQVQLLRVLQEHTYKRLGSNTWRQTDFRLICATNRDLLAEAEQGRFRHDLYYRIATWVFRLPPLRERVEDILPLVQHFIKQARPGETPLELDPRTEEYFLTRNYPGNVRDVRNLVFRIVARHVGPGPLTIGDIPNDERRMSAPRSGHWTDGAMEVAVRRALAQGVGLKELRSSVEEMAIRIAVEDEQGSLQRAARKLGVTDRALQVRRAEERQRLESILASEAHPGTVISAVLPAATTNGYG